MHESITSSCSHRRSYKPNGIDTTAQTLISIQRTTYTFIYTTSIDLAIESHCNTHELTTGRGTRTGVKEPTSRTTTSQQRCYRFYYISTCSYPVGTVSTAAYRSSISKYIFTYLIVDHTVYHDNNKIIVMLVPQHLIL